MSRRRVMVVGAIALVVASAGLAAAWRPLTAHSTGSVPPDRTASCLESGTAGHSTGWLADYRVSGTPGAARIQVAGVQATRDGRRGPVAPAAPWTLSWSPPGAETTSVTTDTSSLPRHPVRTDRLQVLAPDGLCTLFLSSGPVTSGQVAVIGDSVFAAIAKSADPITRSWLISAESGYGWGASPTTWPLRVVDGSWAIGLARGLATRHPAALVVELGVNDALRGSFADTLADPALALGIRTGVMSNVDRLIGEISPQVPCTVLVTAPTHPTELFHGRALYAAEAVLIDDILRQRAVRVAGAHVLLADWATLSGPHHLAVGAPGSWFTPGDDIHPNAAGQGALIQLVQNVVRTCPSGR